VKNTIEFKNTSELKFKDIDDEEFRTYTFIRDGKIFYVTIREPLKINVSPSGVHRIFDSSGECHYIPPGWIHLKWRSKEGADHF